MDVFLDLKEKNKLISDIRTTLELEKENSYYEPVRMSYVFGNNYIECKSNVDRDKMLSIKEYLEEISSYLKDTIDSLKKPRKWKVPITLTINFLFSKDNDEKLLMHSKSEITLEMIYIKIGKTIEIVIDRKTHESIEKLFKSLFFLVSKRLRHANKRLRHCL